MGLPQSYITHVCGFTDCYKLQQETEQNIKQQHLKFWKPGLPQTIMSTLTNDVMPTCHL